MENNIAKGRILHILEYFLNPDYKLEHYTSGYAFCWVKERISSGIGVNTVRNDELEYLISVGFISESKTGEFHNTEKGEIYYLEYKIEIDKQRLDALKLKNI
jgi:hypothetical protein